MDKTPTCLQPFERLYQLLNMGFIYTGINIEQQHIFKAWYSFYGEDRQVHILIKLNQDSNTHMECRLKYITDWDIARFAVVDHIDILNKLIEWNYTPAIAVRRLLKIDNLLI